MKGFFWLHKFVRNIIFENLKTETVLMIVFKLLRAWEDDYLRGKLKYSRIFLTPHSALQYLIIKAVRLEIWSITRISNNVMKEKEILQCSPFQAVTGNIYRQ